ncbi:MAG: NAD(+) synthase [Cellulosilyticaceae bacterium]
MTVFDAEQVTRQLVDWIKVYFENNGPSSKAVIGISGGKDSSVVAAACVLALGKERVVGVLMPNGEQEDIQYSYDLCKHLGIVYTVVNIGETVRAQMIALEDAAKCLGMSEITDVTRINTPARIRMTTLYGVAGLMGGRVANTCNLSEDWVGYATKFGDGAGDFSPLAMLTVQEVKAIGKALGLPQKFIDKTPIDGLCGKTDEDNLGFSYEVLDRYIREGICDQQETKERIDRMHQYSLHKVLPMPHFTV